MKNNAIFDLIYKGNNASSGSGSTSALDIVYTPATPSNYSDIPVNVQEALDTLSQDIYNIGSGDIGGVILGTTDPFGRHQIWNKLTNSVIRLGSLSGDGDPTDVTSEGIVVYGQNASELPMASSDFGYARIKPYRFGLYDSTNAGFVGYIFEFNTHNDEWFITDNLGNKKIKFTRSTGTFEASNLSDGSNSISMGDLVNYINSPKSGLFEDKPSTNLYTGQMYFATDKNKPAWYNGLDWVDATGSVIS